MVVVGVGQLNAGCIDCVAIFVCVGLLCEKESQDV
jgi:hypothetical protein